MRVQDLRNDVRRGCEPPAQKLTDLLSFDGHWKALYVAGDRSGQVLFIVQRAACRVQRAGCRVQRAACRFQGAGCRVQGAGCRVQCFLAGTRKSADFFTIARGSDAVTSEVILGGWMFFMSEVPF